MRKTFYFMAGLPRSGNTLLSAILNQNPNFYVGPDSPVLHCALTLENFFSTNLFFNSYQNLDRVDSVISNLLENYYFDVNKPIVIDRNHSWNSKIKYINGYFRQTPKVICPVRNIDEILASFIALHRRNPYQINGKINFIDEILIKNNIPLTDDNRCDMLLSKTSPLGDTLEGLKKAFIDGFEKQIHLVEYNDLINNPNDTLKKIYEFLEQDYFQHSFDNIVDPYSPNSLLYGFNDMHRISNTLKKSDFNPKDFLSEKILQKCQNLEFWRNINDLTSIS